MGYICFPERLKEALKRRGMSQKELSERTGISRAAISQYISGIILPRHDRLKIISEKLCVSESWLLGYESSDDENLMDRCRRLEADYERLVEENEKLKEKLKNYEKKGM